MKSIYLPIIAHLTLIPIIAVSMEATPTATPAPVAKPSSSNSTCNPDVIIFKFPKQELTSAEQELILQQLEQEKLLRDVYNRLNEKWQQPLFQKIPHDEQRHNVGIKALVTKYQLTDPTTDKAVGVFTREPMTQFYNDWITQGSVSLNEALMVGVALEEKDVVTLEQAIAATDNFDVQLVFKQLLKGSKNHLRELIKLLIDKGISYTPRYLKAADFQQISNSPLEKSIYDDPSQIPCAPPRMQTKLPIEGQPNLRKVPDPLPDYTNRQGFESEFEDDDD
jgi:hypothetical protein